MKRFFYLVSLAGQSAWNRRGTLLLIVLAISFSVTLLLGIERVRTQVRASFVQAVSGADLVVGARGGDIQLMLYAVFHLGGASANMTWESAQKIAALPEVAWSIPISLGDSHRGYPVVATNGDFFSRYRFQGDRRVVLAEGREFASVFEVVLGAEAAKSLGYALDQKITLSHGSGGGRLAEHDDKPFTVVGLLEPTGTPVDRSLYISLAGMEAIHIDWRGGAPIPGLAISAEQAEKFNLEPKSITAMLLGLERRGRVFAVQKKIGEWPDEALMGVMPGVVMDQLWRMVGMGEKALFLISAMVTVTGLAGLVSAILAGLGERRRELAILRSAGARPLDVMTLLSLEGLLLTLSGIAFGLLLLALLVSLFGPLLADRYGLLLQLSPPTAGEWSLLGGVCLAGLLASLIPGLKAYRLSLADGLTAGI